MKAGKAASETFNLCIVLSYNHFISSISCSFLHPTCLSLPHPSFSSLIFSPSFSLPLFSLSCFFHILPSSLPSHSLTHCFLLPQIKLYRGRIHGQPTPLLPSAPHFPPHHTLLPSSHPPTPPPHLYLSAYLHISPLLFLSFSLSVSHTQTHTQNEQINYVAMLVREEITVVRDDKTGDVERSHCKQQLLPKKNYKVIHQCLKQTKSVPHPKQNLCPSFFF